MAKYFTAMKYYTTTKLRLQIIANDSVLKVYG